MTVNSGERTYFLIIFSLLNNRWKRDASQERSQVESGFESASVMLSLVLDKMAVWLLCYVFWWVAMDEEEFGAWTCL